MSLEEKRDALNTPGEPGDCGNCSKVQCSRQIIKALEMLDRIYPNKPDSDKK